jgi:hypothetical protein
MRPNPEDLLLYAVGFLLWSTLLYYTIVEPLVYQSN